MELEILKIDSITNPANLSEDGWHGDLLFSEDYAIDYLDPEKDFKQKILRLNFLSGDTWMALVRAKIMSDKYVREFLELEEMKYECPYMNYDPTFYYWWMPICILTDNIEKYRYQPEGKDYRLDLTIDESFMKDKNSVFKLGIMSNLKNGHGYDFGRLTTDGEAQKIRIKVRLSNGDILVVQTFEWFNK
jgi:hypothetical protein